MSVNMVTLWKKKKLTITEYLLTNIAASWLDFNLKNVAFCSLIRSLKNVKRCSAWDTQPTIYVRYTVSKSSNGCGPDYRQHQQNRPLGYNHHHHQQQQQQPLLLSMKSSSSPQSYPQLPCVSVNIIQVSWICSSHFYFPLIFFSLTSIVGNCAFSSTLHERLSVIIRGLEL